LYQRVCIRLLVLALNQPVWHAHAGSLHRQYFPGKHLSDFQLSGRIGVLFPDSNQQEELREGSRYHSKQAASRDPKKRWCPLQIYFMGSTGGYWTRNKLHYDDKEGRRLDHSEDFDRDLTGAPQFNKYVNEHRANLERKVGANAGGSKDGGNNCVLPSTTRNGALTGVGKLPDAYPWL